MKSNKTTVLLILLIIAILAGVFLFYKNSDKIIDWLSGKSKNSNTAAIDDGINRETRDFKLSGEDRTGRDTKYSSMISLDNYYNNIYYSAKDFNLPTNLFKYRNKIKVRLTYSPEDLTVYECKILNAETGEVIENATNEKMIELFGGE